MLRFYFEVAQATYRRQLIYRWANLAGLLTNIFFGIVTSSVVIALFHARSTTAGYNLRDSLSYIWLSQSFIMIVVPFGWVELMLTVRSGDVVSDLSKPCDFFLYWFSREMGHSFYYLFWRALPTYLAGFFIFGLEGSASWVVLLIFSGILLLASMIGIIFRILLNLTSFWLLEARSVIVLGLTVAQFFAGTLLPVIFFPSWLALLGTWLPFNGMVNLPIQVFLGKMSGSSLLFALLVQVVWLLLLILIVRLLTSVATRRVIVQGG